VRVKEVLLNVSDKKLVQKRRKKSGPKFRAKNKVKNSEQNLKTKLRNNSRTKTPRPQHFEKTSSGSSWSSSHRLQSSSGKL
jgi:hypothetical protein